MEGSMSFFDFLKVLGRGSSGTKPAGNTPVRANARTFTLEEEAGAKALQDFLSGLGYLDPPADGKWGGTSMRALDDCLHYVGEPGWDMTTIQAGSPLPADVVRALNRATPLPVRKGSADPFLDRVVAGMLATNAFIARCPGYLNIVTAEGHDLDGKRNTDRRDEFNDAKMVFTLSQTGVPTLLGRWEATSTAGWYWTRNPMVAAGAFNIAEGWQKAWSPGDYHGGALLQARDLRGYRDQDRKGIRDLRHPVSGQFGVHHHQGYNLPRGEMRNASAGCQVIRKTADQQEFMAIVKKEPRYLANRSYIFAATVLKQSDVPPE
jgi:hypothetical protein